jgi:hypothetical protein
MSTDRTAQDSLHREIDALIGVKHGEAIVAALKEAAVAFLKRAKPLLAASDVAAVAAASSATAASEAAAVAVATTADESAGKRKREEEMQENPEDARNRRRLERAQKTLAALTAEQDRWKALDSEQFGAADLAASKRVDAQQSKQRRPTVLEDTRRVVAATALPLDDARRAFESISMNVSGRRACAAGVSIVFADSVSFSCRSWTRYCRWRAMRSSARRRPTQRSARWRSACVHTALLLLSRRQPTRERLSKK